MDNSDSYFQPNQKNFGAIDAFIKPNLFFQMTVSNNHSIDYKSLLEALEATGAKDPMFIFVVPRDVFPTLKKQNYTNGKKVVAEGRIDGKVKAVTQYALCLPIE